ncbi:hypothetical protein HMPREF1977_1837 [Capnocytophaga ochracea F0287]|uniref:DUF5672 domain-containing protein n=1 Tax=Capnocytophaga ochracea F0287 TaxID=873517 RepID=E4MTW5_CAPOC|nr:DUF5672 family protein [Capnocytophaga ochracea]EFS96921.1 hypothetical protein HMPREF1977_1837 [Capnocytophaga ochracea F0287]EJF45476.1 hypothetical protein HMPREF1319_0636 [Capnocytophaga ochracea str. Holt 25]UEB42580.1 hypothetical protein LK419_07105 [Capnocytophaga ochracea]
MVNIVIPIYKEEPSGNDIISIKRVFRVLKEYPITFVHPKSLDIRAYEEFGKVTFRDFDDVYFKSIDGYNQLMLSIDFYEAFTEKYILIYQTDAYIFRDDLLFWCKKDYDYIGAPWIRRREKAPIIKKIWDSSICFIKQAINYKGNRKTQKNKILLYNEVGNGGFSLRKREKFIEVLKQLTEQTAVYLKPSNRSTFYAEDVFFSIEPKRNGIDFKKPNYKEACFFSIENKVKKALAFNNQILPMGCHRWEKENREIWAQFIKDETEGF